MSSPSMSRQLTNEDARQSLHDHAAQKGAEIRDKYGPQLGWTELLRLLEDRVFVRYPCSIVFDAGPLLSGEFAHPVPQGERPEDGFKICVHPYFESQLERVPWLVLYQLVLVNYGDFATVADAEVFGANALAISTDDYYQNICSMADELAGATAC